MQAETWRAIGDRKWDMDVCVREGIQPGRRASVDHVRLSSAWLEQRGEKGEEGEEATKAGGSCVDEALYTMGEFGPYGGWVKQGRSRNPLGSKDTVLSPLLSPPSQ